MNAVRADIAVASADDRIELAPVSDTTSLTR
jgi:hypothetical protein